MALQSELVRKLTTSKLVILSVLAPSQILARAELATAVPVLGRTKTNDLIPVAVILTTVSSLIAASHMVAITGPQVPL